MKYASEDGIGAGFGLETGDFDIPETVISEMRFEGFYPAPVECVGICLSSSSQIIGINGSVIAQHFSVADRHDGTSLALSLQPAPPNHVLPHVKDKNIWLWFGQRNRFDLPSNADGFIGLGCQDRTYFGRDVGYGPGLVIEAR